MRAKFINESLKEEKGLIIKLIEIGEILEMANIYPSLSNLENVVIWVGKPDPRHGHRVKVSNIPNTFDENNCFIIKIPSLEVMFFPKKSFITSKLLKKIKEFVNLYSNDFIDLSIEKISNKQVLDIIKNNKPKKEQLKNVNENTLFEYNSKMSRRELDLMASMDDMGEGIEDVTFWIGPNPKNLRKIRVKVSNIPRRYTGEDCFEITIPDFKIIGHVNKNFIDKDKMDKIMKFIKLNINIIIEYSLTPYMDTMILIDSLVPV